MEINGKKPELNNIATNCEKSQNVVCENRIPEHWIAALFAKFQARYGHKWTSAMQGIEETAVAEWSHGLAGLTGEQFRNGLDLWKSAWPPSLPEFKDACLGKIQELNDHGLNYKPPCFSLFKILDRSRLLSSSERDAERKNVKPHIEAMRELCKEQL